MSSSKQPLALNAPHTMVPANATQDIVHTVQGTWSAVPSFALSERGEVAAQVITGFHEAGRSTTSAPLIARPATRLHETICEVSRHIQETPQNCFSMHRDRALCPAYTEIEDLPAYVTVAEPPTLAMYLFKFGFGTLFPLFWLVGVFVLFCPLAPPENWSPTKSEADKTELLDSLRRTEIKWARRCLVAFSALTLAVIAAFLTIVFAHSA